MREQKKVNLKPEIITKYFLENVEMTSDEVPGWLLDLNNGIADPDIFENAGELEREDISDIIDTALTSIFLLSIVENDVGEISIDTERFEALRQDYIMTVTQRLDIVYSLRSISLPFIKVKPFLILWIGDVVINISKLEKTREQLLKSEVIQCQEWANRIEQLPN